MFNDRLVLSDGSVYLTKYLIVTSLERQLRKQITPTHAAISLAWKKKSSGLHIIRVFSGDEFWQRGKEKQKVLKVQRIFCMEKMGSSCHIMRKIKSKVTIFREQLSTSCQIIGEILKLSTSCSDL